jgi:hypothetical protein
VPETVIMPLTSSIVPVVIVASPQSIVAMKSPAVLARLVLVKRATTPSTTLKFAVSGPSGTGTSTSASATVMPATTAGWPKSMVAERCSVPERLSLVRMMPTLSGSFALSSA